MDKSTSLAIVFAPGSENDIREVLERSEEKFGPGAASRYAELIAQAVQDLASDPERIGTRKLGDRPSDLCTYHLLFSRTRVAGGRVKEPRHLVLYRVQKEQLEIIRVLHESRDLKRHLPKK